MPPLPSELAYVPFVSVEHMMGLVHHIGIETVLRDIADEIEADFKRWELFDKTPRVASHSEVGVIELMPTSDGEMYGFKYVNGHPKNTKEGLQTVTAFGLLADVDFWLPKASKRDDRSNRAAHSGDQRNGREISGAEGRGHDGDDRQRRAVGVPVSGI